MPKMTPHEPTGAIPVSPSLGAESEPEVLEQKNYPVSKRVFYLSVQAVINAVIVGFIAKFLVALIGLITNISFYGKFSFEERSPADNHLGWMVLFAPIAGGLIVGIMARFGSKAIRGDGIPEAMEQVLRNESKIKPVITFLKPLSSAIAIGTGGPFGAEGPIIATGGAFGSLIGQIMRISPNERKILLAAGACAGISAIFGTPLAAVLLGIELLLFEFSPRSIIPVALSSVTGAAMHYILFSGGPMFAMAPIPAASYFSIIIYTIFGILIGVAAAYLSKGVYLMEDLFEKLPVHWMWWPAIGAVAVGIIGYYAPHTLGVGYENIRNLLNGSLPLQMMLILCFLKFISWAVYLGSGTAGGTLAPIFTIGGAFGGLLGYATLHFFPNADISISTCVLIGMAAMFAGASRALLTSIIFALEATMQPNGLLPLMASCTAAYFVSFFLMKGSLMTEKIRRHGVFTPNTYESDILQKVMVKEVSNTTANLLSGANTIKEAREWIKENAVHHGQTMAFVVVDAKGHLIGTLPRKEIFNKEYDDHKLVSDLIRSIRPYIYGNSRLSIAVDIMDKYQADLLPVVTNDKHKKVLGTLSHKEIFMAYRQRRNENEVNNPNISLRKESLKIILKGRQFLNR